MLSEREGCNCFYCSPRRTRRELTVAQKPIVIPPEPQWSPYVDGQPAVRAFYTGVSS